MSLPEIFKNKIEDSIKTSQTVYYSGNNDRSSNLFNKLPINAVIETKNRTFKTRIIGKTDNYLVTDTQDVISISDCLNIKEL